jgi:Leucine-rich repeat (LRR) protein
MAIPSLQVLAAERWFNQSNDLSCEDSASPALVIAGQFRAVMREVLQDARWLRWVLQDAEQMVAVGEPSEERESLRRAICTLDPVSPVRVQEAERRLPRKRRRDPLLAPRAVPLVLQDEEKKRALRQLALRIGDCLFPREQRNERSALLAARGMLTRLNRLCGSPRPYAPLRVEYWTEKRVQMDAALEALPQNGDAKEIRLPNWPFLTLPPELSERSRLQRVIVKGKLTVFPDVLLTLSDLREVVLRSAPEAPEKMTEVPEGVGCLRELRVLALPCQALASVPKSLGRLRRLNNLALPGNQLQEVPESLSECKRLSILRLEDNALTRLPEGVLPSALQCLYVSGNRLQGLPEDLGRLQRLITLEAARNPLRRIPDALSENLKELYLQACELESLPPALGRLRLLRVLHLEGNKLRALPEDLSGWSSLQELYVQKNQLEELPHLEHAQALDRLDASQNQLREIPPQLLRNASALRELILKKNRIERLPDEIEEGSPLTSLCISRNRLTELPKALDNLRKLRTFQAAHNQLRALRCLHVVRRLNDLDLSHNELNEEVLPQIAQASSLLQLNLSHNKIRGEISIAPPSRSRTKRTLWKNMTRLDLSHNQITHISWKEGHNPHLENLVTLLLNNNRLVRLPRELAELRELRDLFVENNLLTELPHVAGAPPLRRVEAGSNPLVQEPFGRLALAPGPEVRRIVLEMRYAPTTPGGRCVRVFLHENLSEQELLLQLERPPLSRTVEHLRQTGVPQGAEWGRETLRLAAHCVTDAAYRQMPDSHYRQHVQRLVYQLAASPPLQDGETPESWGAQHARDNRIRLADAMYLASTHK